MTYQILLYPRRPGQDWAEVIAADEADHGDGPDQDLATLNRGVATFRRIEARLREQLTEPVRTWAAEELGGDIFGEFQTRDSRLRVDLYDRSAAVSVPYGGPDAAAHDLARLAVEVVAAETGYEAFDPQVQAGFDGTFDHEAGQTTLSQDPEADDLWADEPAGAGQGDGAVAPLEGRVLDGTDKDGTGADAGADGSGDAADQEAPLDPKAERARLLEQRRQEMLERRRDPAVLRRRGWFYVIFGVLLIGLGMLRVSEGDTGVLTWLFFGIGFFELLGGRFMFGQSRQMQAQRDAAASEAGTEPEAGAASASDGQIPDPEGGRVPDPEGGQVPGTEGGPDEEPQRP